MSSRWWTVGVAALLAGSAVFWGLRLAVQAMPVPAGAQVAQAGVGTGGDLSRLLGQEAPPPSAASNEPPPDTRFQLLGVMAPRGGEQGGIALIAVDGKPPRAVRVGQAVDGQHVLKQVTARGALLGPAEGPATISLTAPLLAAAATGTLPGAGPGSVETVAPPARGVFAPGVARPGFPMPGGQLVMQGPGATPIAPARGPNEGPAPAGQAPRPMVPPQLVAPQLQQVPTATQ